MPAPKHHALTCFGGYLRHRLEAGWTWANGEDEPGMVDVPSSLAALVTRETARGLVAEVPISLAEAFDPLRWILLRVDRGDYAVDVTSGMFAALAPAGTGSRPMVGAARAAPAGFMVVLVPAADWRTWSEVFRIMPACSAADAARMQAKAIALGWALPGVGDGGVYPDLEVRR